MKISIEELNLAYLKVIEIKNLEESIKDIIEVDIERNPLTDENYFNDSSDYVTPFKLQFIFDSKISRYVLLTDVEIIDDDTE